MIQSNIISTRPAGLPGCKESTQGWPVDSFTSGSFFSQNCIAPTYCFDQVCGAFWRRHGNEHVEQGNRVCHQQNVGELNSKHYCDTRPWRQRKSLWTSLLLLRFLSKLSSGRLPRHGDNLSLRKLLHRQEAGCCQLGGGERKVSCCRGEIDRQSFDLQSPI